MVYISNPIYFPTYEQGIKVVIGDTLKECCLENTLPWEEGEDEKMDAYCQQVGEYIYIVLRKDNTRKVVLHECIHAVDNMYANISARMDVENDEIYVRDVSHLQDIVLTMFEEHINSGKNTKNS